MAKTNWQDPQTSEIRSTHISGLMDAVGKLEESIGMDTVAEENIPLTEVYISAEDRYRIFQAPSGKRNWLSSPAPVIKKNGEIISEGFVIDYGGGAIALSVNDTEENTYTADVTYVTPLSTSLKSHLAENAVHISKFPLIIPEADDAPRLQRAITYCEENGKALYLPNGTYICSSTGLNITKGIKIFGESKDACILDFSGLAAGSAISIAKTTNVLNLYMGFMYIKGNTNITCFDIGSNAITSLTDSQFQQIYAKTFALGLKATYAWMNTWTNCRFQSCTKPFELGNQVNATHFDTCSFVAFSTAGEFTNCEGIVFTSPNISNISSAIGFTLFQSSVIMDNPYFENVTDVLASLGTSSESIGSSLMINGGVISGTIALNYNNETIHVNGSRVTGLGFKIKNSHPPAPTKFSRNIKVNLKDTNFDNKNTLILDYTHDVKPSFAGAYGGSIRYFKLYRDFSTVEQQAAVNGIVLTSSLVNGEQYTLAYAIRKKADVSSIEARIDSNQSLGLGASIQADTEDWEIRYMPFISSGTTFKLLFTGTLEIKMIKIFKGIINSDLQLPSVPHAWYSTAAPAEGTWQVGDRVYNLAPAVGQPKSWVCTVAGTMGTLTGITGSIETGTKALTVNDATGLRVGEYITIAGVTGVKTITAIDGLVVTISENADATVADAAVAYSNATWVSEGNL